MKNLAKTLLAMGALILPGAAVYAQDKAEQTQNGNGINWVADPSHMNSDVHVNGMYLPTGKYTAANAEAGTNIRLGNSIFKLGGTLGYAGRFQKDAMSPDSQINNLQPPNNLTGDPITPNNNTWNPATPIAKYLLDNWHILYGTLDLSVGNFTAGVGLGEIVNASEIKVDTSKNKVDGENQNNNNTLTLVARLRCNSPVLRMGKTGLYVMVEGLYLDKTGAYNGAFNLDFNNKAQLNAGIKTVPARNLYTPFLGVTVPLGNNDKNVPSFADE